MALTKGIIKTAYPLPVYNYKVTIGAETVSFSEISGLNISYEKVVYKHGLSFHSGPVIIRAQPNEISITLKRGVVAKRAHLYDWLTGNISKDIFIDLCDERGNAIIRWKVSKALPLKMEAPAFNAESNSVAIESIEVIAQDIRIEYL
jgi:phage tail-like protein